MQNSTNVLICAIAFFVSAITHGQEIKPFAVGAWSNWEGNLRGRLILAKGRAMLTPDHVETLVFVELENRLGSGRTIDVYFTPESLIATLLDNHGNPVNERQLSRDQIAVTKRRSPKSTWVSLPEGASLRIKTSPSCASEYSDIGLLVPLCDKQWVIEASDEKEYFLAGVFTADQKAIGGRDNAWHGLLNLPRTSVSVKKSKEVKRRAFQPPKLEIQEAKAAEHGGYSFAVKVTHPNDQPLPYVGYVPESFSPPIPEGRIEPLFKVEYLRNGQWQPSPLGWCGTGLGPVSLPTGKPVTFFVHVDSDGFEAVRVGISWHVPDSSHAEVAWSNHVTNQDLESIP